MVRQITQSRINCEVKFKIYGTILLYPKEGWISMISTRLQEVEPVYNKGQDTVTTN